MSEPDRVFVRRCVLIIAMLVLIALACLLRTVILLVFGSAILALLLTNLSQFVETHLKTSRRISLAIVMAALAVLFFALSAFFGWRIARQFTELSTLLPKAVNALQAWMERQPFGDRLITGLQHSGINSAVPALFDLPGYALIAIGGVADVLLVAAGGIYMAAQPDLYRRGILRLLPANLRADFLALLDDLSLRLRQWLLSQFAAMAIVGFLVGGSLWAIGVPAAGALGLFAGAAEFVPIVGPIASAVPAMLMALIVGMEEAGWTLLFFVIIQQIEGNLIIPLLQQKVVRIPPLVTLFAIVSAGLLFGLLGVILATPTAIVMLTVGNRYLQAPDSSSIV